MPRYIDADALMAQLNRKKAEPCNKRYTEGFNDALMRFRSMIHSAPTVLPDEAMKDVYLAETLRNSAEHFMTTDYEWSHSMVHLLMDAADVVDEIEKKAHSDVPEKNVGKWIRINVMSDEWFKLKCSCCQKEFEIMEGELEDYILNYCPNCGAKMEGQP